MAYIGAQPNKQLTKTTSQSFNGTGSATAFTLNRAVNTGEELEVFVDNVQQEPGVGKSYTATGTTLTFDEAPPLGTGNVYVIYRGQAEVTTRLEAPDLSITSAKLAATIAPTNLETTSSTFKMTDLTSNAFYRTGDWIPVASSVGATDGTATIYSGTNSRSVGKYERIGDVVHITFRLSLEAATISYVNGGADGQGLKFTGFPFNVLNVTNYFPALSVGYFSSWTSWSASYTPMGILVPGTKDVQMFHAAGNGVTTTLTNYFKSSGADIIASATYRTDDA